MSHRTVIALLAVVAAPVTLRAQARDTAAAPSPAAIVAADSAAVERVVMAYHAALAARDSARALALLAPDVVVLESGGLESLADYRSHHLPADIGFAAAVPSKRSVSSVRVQGDVAWVASTSVTQGEFRGRAINSSGAELMVLTRAAGGWRISAIHWSSRNRRAP